MRSSPVYAILSYMAELRLEIPSSSPEITKAEVYFPDDADLGTGTFTTTFEPNVFPPSKVIMSIALNVPAFQMSTTVNPNRDLVVLLGRADGSDPMAQKSFDMPERIPRNVPHSVGVSFSGWQITEASWDFEHLLTPRPGRTPPI